MPLCGVGRPWAGLALEISAFGMPGQGKAALKTPPQVRTRPVQGQVQGWYRASTELVQGSYTYGTRLVQGSYKAPTKLGKSMLGADGSRDAGALAGSDGLGWRITLLTQWIPTRQSRLAPGCRDTVQAPVVLKAHLPRQDGPPCRRSAPPSPSQGSQSSLLRLEIRTSRMILKPGAGCPHPARHSGPP